MTTFTAIMFSAALGVVAAVILLIIIDAIKDILK